MFNSISIQLTNFFDGKPEILVLDAARIIGFRQNSDKTTSILLDGAPAPVQTTVWESELQWILSEIQGMAPGSVFRYDGRDKHVQAAIRSFRVHTLGWPEQDEKPSARQRADAFAPAAEARRVTGAADSDRVGAGKTCPECEENVHEDDFVLDRKLPDGHLFTGCTSCFQSLADSLVVEAAG